MLVQNDKLKKKVSQLEAAIKQQREQEQRGLNNKEAGDQTEYWQTREPLKVCKIVNYRIHTRSYSSFCYLSISLLFYSIGRRG